MEPPSSYYSLCKTLISITLFLCMSSPFSISNASLNLRTISFDEAYRPLFGDSNVMPSSDNRGVRLLLDRFTGSGFISSSMYSHGFFSAKIKLPGNYTAGVVVAFYASNGDLFDKTHDELDIEFLGNIKGKPWRFQTNVYGNGSTCRGREERYTLWFDPTESFHRYTILWTSSNIIFYVDDVAIREVVHRESMGGDYPSKPMFLYATIWDGSSWATSGGKYKANYKNAPFVAEFTDLSLDGCVSKSIQKTPRSCSLIDAMLESKDYATITPKHRIAMRKFRGTYMYYAYCYDVLRYPLPLPECVITPYEKRRFKDTGRLKFSRGHGHHSHHIDHMALAASNGHAAS